ncbi:MAG: hypothetical protein HY938_09385 [Nitrosomonadales bacterium]|nr:hypothetical protein [Nitrosomonadales bacterium]
MFWVLQCQSLYGKWLTWHKCPISMLRPEKSSSLKVVQRLSPQYVELLRDLQKGGGRISFTPEVAQIQNTLGAYVLIYDDELKIGRAMLLACFGKEGMHDFAKEVEALSLEEQQEIVDGLASVETLNEIAEALDSFDIPQSLAEWQAARDELAKLPKEEREETQKRGVYFWCFFFSSFFNTLSLMVHGTKMTALIPRALAGDDDAFLKAVQIDRMLLLHHPYFRDRKARAQNDGEAEFLSKLAYRESNPTLRGAIRYPGLYMLLGTLESIGWLDELKHEEILDLCENAGLDLYQNRIEDVNYLTKRLGEYRVWKKVNLSMQ